MINAMSLTDEQLADLIDDAADQLEKRGWTQRTFCRKRTSEKGPKGAVCMMGGVALALFGEDVFTKPKRPHFELNAAWEQARQALVEGIQRTRSRSHNVYGWNDYAGRSEQEVLDMMRDTAKRLRMHRDQTVA